MPPSYEPYFIALFVVALLVTVAGMILPATGLIKMYEKQGEMILTQDSVTINGETLNIDEIKKIDVTAKDYKGARSSDGSGNSIEIWTKDNRDLNFRFVVNSKQQLEDLKQVLKDYNKNGVEVFSLSFNIE